MATTKQKSKYVVIRVTPSTHKAFHRRAEAYGGVSDVLRELIEAFLDDRLVIQPNPKKESLYVTGN